MKNFGYFTHPIYVALCLLLSLLSVTAHAACTLAANDLLSTSFEYETESTEDSSTRHTKAYVTRLNNLGAEKRPVVVLMPGWGGSGDVDAQEWNE